MAKFVVHLSVSARRFLNQGRRVASAQRMRIQAVKRAILLLNGKKFLEHLGALLRKDATLYMSLVLFRDYARRLFSTT